MESFQVNSEEEYYLLYHFEDSEKERNNNSNTSNETVVRLEDTRKLAEFADIIHQRNSQVTII